MKKAWQKKPPEDFPLDAMHLVTDIPPEVAGHTFDMEAPHETFHEQSKYHRATVSGHAGRIKAFLEQPALIERAVRGPMKSAGLPRTALPPPAGMTADLSTTLRRRVSARRDTLGVGFSAETLSAILHHSVRVNRKTQVTAAKALTQTFRPYPSAGGLYPCEVYLILDGVTGLPPGIYQYDAIQHALIKKPNDGAFKQVETGPSGIANIPCVFAVTAVFERSLQKYGQRGYRFALMEAGHILQNLSLCAGALGLAGYVSASFYEAELEALLQVDGVSEAVLACFVAGEGLKD